MVISCLRGSPKDLQSKEVPVRYFLKIIERSILSSLIHEQELYHCGYYKQNAQSSNLGVLLVIALAAYYSLCLHKAAASQATA